MEWVAIWGLAGTMMTSVMFVCALFKQYVPYHLQDYLVKCFYKMLGIISISDNVHIKFTEYNVEGLKKSIAYDLIRNYLSSKSTALAKRLKANETSYSKSLVLSLDDYEAVEDVFHGVKVIWSSSLRKSEDKSDSREIRYFTLSFHERHREIITTTYLDHVLRQGGEFGLRNRERKLYINSSSQDRAYFVEGRWRNVPFKHPATFESLAMDPEMKEGIKKDLIRFSKSKDYYKKIGKPWKRGYLLFGPPGTGKSTMISAMANFLNYDVYDLELTTVDNNSELKTLMLDTPEKCIVAIEDIDCSLGLTGQRKKREDEDEDEEDEKEEWKEPERRLEKVTLSGLLNAIDGLWSACSGEKIIVFTTNFVDKLDPALIRRGRMDNHIEMSYCRFEAFKVLAKNYLDIESHGLYGEIKILVEETDMSPADVAENLMPKSNEDNADICLRRLIKSLEKAKKLAHEEKKKKAEREVRRQKKKAEEEDKKKKEAEENGKQDLSKDVMSV